MWLAIEGIPGAGKTTTASLLARQSGEALALERQQDHPFLEAYYDDPARFSFETELAFALIQLSGVKALGWPNSLISDFAPAKNRIFAARALSATDLELLAGVEERLWRDQPPPTLAVFLDPPLESCLGRVRSRGRPYEQGLALNDLSGIRDAYLQQIAILAEHVEVLALTGEESAADVAGLVVSQCHPT